MSCLYIITVKKRPHPFQQQTISSKKTVPVGPAGQNAPVKTLCVSTSRAKASLSQICEKMNVNFACWKQQAK